MPQNKDSDWEALSPASNPSNGGDWEPLTPATNISAPNTAPQAPVKPTMVMGQQIETLPEKLAKLSPDQRARYEAGTSMALPATLMGIGATGPLGAIERSGITGYLGNLARTGLKSLAGSELGKLAGRQIGGLFGQREAETGGQIGGTIGAIGGPLAPNSLYARLPLGFGRFILSNEELAAERAAMKGAQRAADVAAGLRKPSTLGTVKPQEASGALGKVADEALGERPSQFEEEATQLVRKPIVTPSEAARETQMVPPRNPGEPEAAYRARVLGLIRAGRAARGMAEPQF